MTRAERRKANIRKSLKKERKARTLKEFEPFDNLHQYSKNTLKKAKQGKDEIKTGTKYSEQKKLARMNAELDIYPES